MSVITNNSPLTTSSARKKSTNCNTEKVDTYAARILETWDKVADQQSFSEFLDAVGDIHPASHLLNKRECELVRADRRMPWNSHYTKMLWFGIKWDPPARLHAVRLLAKHPFLLLAYKLRSAYERMKEAT